MHGVLNGGKTQGFVALVIVWTTLFCSGSRARAQGQPAAPTEDVETLVTRAENLFVGGYHAYGMATLDDILFASRNQHGQKSAEHAKNVLRVGRMAFDRGAYLWAKDFFDEGWKSIPLPLIRSDLGLRMSVARGRTEAAMGDVQAAEKSLATAAKLASELPGDHSTQVALLDLERISRALEQEDAGALAGADRVVAKLLATLKDDPDHAVDHARALAVAADILARRGELALAVKTLDQAYKELAALKLGEGRLLMDMRHRIAHVAQIAKRGPAALAIYRRALQGRQRLLASFSRYSSQADLGDFDRSFRTDIDGLVSLDLEPAGLPEGGKELALLRNSAANTVLERKGWIIEAQTQQLAYMRGLGTQQAAGVDDTLARARGRFANLIVRGPRFDKPWDSVVLRRLVSAKRSAERLAGRLSLSERPPPFVFDESLPAKLEKGLPQGAAHLEYVVYRPIDTSRAAHEDYLDEPHYAVYLFRKGGPPQVIGLGPAKTIDALIGEYRKLSSRPTQSPREVARKLDALVMEPVRAKLGDERTLFVAPDGQLSLLPFAALRDPDGAHLLQRYSIRYLSSGRELVGRDRPLEPGAATDMVIVADPAFSLEEAPAAARDGRDKKALLGGIGFPALPGTQQEGRSLHEQHPGSRLLLGKEATETTLKELEHPRLLHIATHGFFLSEEQAVQNGSRGLVRVKADEPATRSAMAGSARNEPLLRSGLAFANANSTRSSDEAAGRDLMAQGADDGVLTALEASGLDLKGTELVVLSACETGVGEVRNGDGVYGLRRALAIAGARTQVMSLWKVDDAATRDLMLLFYRGLDADEGRAESLRRAQLALAKSETWSHPYYWASFIPYGEDRSLDGKEPTLVDPNAVEPWVPGSTSDGRSRGAGATATPGQVKPVQKGCACRVGESAGDQRGGLVLLLLGLLVAGRIRKVSQ